jgi:hypothetical protein
MNVRLVSCFYPTPRIKRYYQLGERSARLYAEAAQYYPLSLALYCQDKEDVKCFEGLPNVDIIVTKRPSHPGFAQCKQSLIYPVTDQPTKDTPDFYELMMHKTWFMAETAKTCRTDQIAWIDYGILRLASHDEIFLSFLVHLSRYNCDKICSPGYSYPSHPAQIYTLARQELITGWADWRLLGTYINVPAPKMVDFADRVQDSYDRLFEKGYMTYEINVWAHLAQNNLSEWVVYSADHNDRLFCGHPGFVRLSGPINLTKDGDPCVRL